MKLLHTLALLLLLALPGQAKVLIYKGTLKNTISAPLLTIFPPLVNVYFLMDPDNSQTTDLVYYTKDGKHQSKDTVQTRYFATASAPAGKSYTAVTFSGSSVTDITHFSTSLLLLTGTNTTLQYTRVGGHQTTPFPRTFTGQQTIVVNNAGAGNIQLSQFLLTYQSKATLDANDAGKTLSMVADDLAAAVLKLGYMP